jgi:hypothetical protein
MTDIPTSDEMQFVDGRAAFFEADFAGAETIFTRIKESATDDVTRNCARLHLAVVYGFQYVPGICSAEAAENIKSLDRAEAECREVLDDNSTPDQRETAESNLIALHTMRQMECSKWGQTQN